MTRPLPLAPLPLALAHGRLRKAHEAGRRAMALHVLADAPRPANPHPPHTRSHAYWQAGAHRARQLIAELLKEA